MMQILHERKSQDLEVVIYWDGDDKTEVWITTLTEVFGLDAGENGCMAMDIFNHPLYWRDKLPHITTDPVELLLAS
jgi:hypothetical protein